MAKALAKRKKNLPARTEEIDPEQMAGAGFETADQTAYIIPRLYMLQDLSPQTKPKSDAFVKGAKPGMMFNSVTKQLFDHLYVVACMYRRTFVEWKTRDDGGGFIYEHLAIDPAWTKQMKGPWLNEKTGTIINDTRNFFVLNAPKVDSDGVPVEPNRIVLSLTASALKTAGEWMTQMSEKKGTRGDGTRYTQAMFSSVFKLTSMERSNDDGFWYGWKIEDTGVELDNTDVVFKYGYDYWQQITEGLARAEAPAQDDDSGADDSALQGYPWQGS